MTDKDGLHGSFGSDAKASWIITRANGRRECSPDTPALTRFKIAIHNLANKLGKR